MKTPVPWKSISIPGRVENCLCNLYDWGKIPKTVEALRRDLRSGKLHVGCIHGYGKAVHDAVLKLSA